MFGQTENLPVDSYTLKGLNYMICKKSGWTGEVPTCDAGQRDEGEFMKYVVWAELGLSASLPCI